MALPPDTTTVVDINRRSRAILNLLSKREDITVSEAASRAIAHGLRLRAKNSLKQVEVDREDERLEALDSRMFWTKEGETDNDEQ